MVDASTFFDTGSGSKIPTGIHAGVTFSGVDKEDTHIDINFSKDGLTQHRRLFKPKGQYPKEGETLEQAVAREKRSQLVEITTLCCVLFGKEYVSNIAAENEDALLAKLITLANSKKDAKVNLKVVPNLKEPKYSEIPKFSYLEPYVEGQEPKLKFTDKEMERMAPKASSGPDTSKLV